ncbi:MAG: calcium/sodium antiporter [Candidatus Aminicenantes bacterium]|jgi:cation:H+ antiporter
MTYLYFAALIFSFFLLFKAADFFVAGASGIANIFRIPKLIVGIVLVSLATTAPEFGVSVIAAFLGNLEISLGNAIGSVICDDGLALALAAFLAPTAIFINCRILKLAALFLLSIDLLAYFLARNGVIGRLEGTLFVLILGVYFVFIIKNPRYRMDAVKENGELTPQLTRELAAAKKTELKKSILLFSSGVLGVILTSFVVNWSAVNIAESFSISETVIGSTIVAIGTSLPEIGTCVAAALRGEGEIAVGNILGADVLNILWIIGVASIVRPLQVELRVINFTFPYMILIVAVMLLLMRIGCRLGKVKGIILFFFYLVYVVLMALLFT